MVLFSLYLAVFGLLLEIATIGMTSCIDRTVIWCFLTCIWLFFGLLLEIVTIGMTSLLDCYLSSSLTL